MASTASAAEEDGPAAAVAAALAALPAGAKILLGYSGGLDSTLLLSLVVRHAPAGLSLQAMHVNHGLQSEAAAWEEQCRSYCARIGVPLLVRRPRLAVRPSGLEARARQARLRAFAAAGVDAVLLGHHANDQAETVLLRLMRGSGPRGLAAMRPRELLPEAKHRELLLRPLLPFDRVQLRTLAERLNLSWVEDPSNSNCDPNRNWLRLEVLPAAAQRFPGVQQALCAAAANQADAAALLDELAAMDAATCCDREGRAVVARLAVLSQARVRNWLAWSLREQGAVIPSGGQLREAARQLVRASSSCLRQQFGNLELSCEGGLLSWRRLDHGLSG